MATMHYYTITVDTAGCPVAWGWNLTDCYNLRSTNTSASITRIRRLDSFSNIFILVFQTGSSSTLWSVIKAQMKINSDAIQNKRRYSPLTKFLITCGIDPNHYSSVHHGLEEKQIEWNSFQVNVLQCLRQKVAWLKTSACSQFSEKQDSLFASMTL